MQQRGLRRCWHFTGDRLLILIAMSARQPRHDNASDRSSRPCWPGHRARAGAGNHLIEMTRGDHRLERADALLRRPAVARALEVGGHD